MIWTAQNEARLFGGSGVDVDLDGCILILRSKRQPRFDLCAADVEVTRHQWNMSEGTALQVRRGAEAVFIAGRGSFFPELPHHAEVVQKPELVMTAADFASFQDAVTGALPETAPARQVPAGRRFLLWDMREGAGIQLLAIFGPLLLTPALLVLPGPFAVHLILMILMLAGAATVYSRAARASTFPVLAVSIEGGFATLDRLQPPKPAVARAALSRGRIEHLRSLGGVFDRPVVRLSIDPLWKIEVGSPREWVGTHGPYTGRPKYLMGAGWWPAFIAALTAACEANQPGLGRK